MSNDALHVVPFSRLTLFGLGDKEACLSRGAQIISRVLRLVEAREDFSFSIENLVHLSAYLRSHPEETARVRDAVSGGRLELGAAWTQMDHRLSAGEDLVRNLLYGKAFAREALGVDPKAVHLGDGGGTTSQYVQVAVKCGIRYVVLTGTGWKQPVLFRWRGPDGSQAFCWNATGGGRLLWEAVRSAPQSRRLRNAEIARQREMHEGRLPLHWGGPMVQPCVSALEELLEWAEDEAIQLRLGTPSGLIPRSRPEERLPVVDDANPPAGAHLEPAFPGTAPMNDPAVCWLSRAEQMSAMAEIVAGFRYPRAVFEAAWLRQLESTSYRYDGAASAEGLERRRTDQQNVIAMASGIAREAERMIAERVTPRDGPEGRMPIVVFNTLSWPRTDLVEVHVTFYGAVEGTDFSRYETYKLVDDSGRTVPFQELAGRQTETAEVRLVFAARQVPANGYATYYLVPGATETQPLVGIQAPELMSPGQMAPEFPEPSFVLEDVEDRVSEAFGGVRIARRFRTAYADLEVDEITGRVRVSGRNTGVVLVDGIHLIGAEDALTDRSAVTGRRFEMAVERVDLEESGEVRATLLVAGKLLSSPCEIRYRVYGELERVDVDLRLQWRDRNPVRVQMVFPVAGGTIRYGTPHGHQKLQEAGCESDSHEAQRICQGWVAVDGPESGFVIASDRKAFQFGAGEVRGEVLHSGLDPASYSYNVIWRGFPDVVTCRYSLRAYPGDFARGNAFQDGWNLHEGMNASVVYDLVSEKSLPDRMQFVSLDGPGIACTTIKQAEDGEGLILRAYETVGDTCEARLVACRNIVSLHETDLMERRVRDLDADAIGFAPFEIKTLRVVLN
ncbi:MAG: glycosyl hydrolase-related protein [Gemmatimonadota bacterium]|nr:glycosyl hydrolase-related protein [Gemmatimonadota bacterium]